MGKPPYYCYKSIRSNRDLGGKIMTKWEHIYNKRYHLLLSYSNARPTPITLNNYASISMGIPRGGPEFPISMHICSVYVCVRVCIHNYIYIMVKVGWNAPKLRPCAG